MKCNSRIRRIWVLGAWLTSSWLVGVSAQERASETQIQHSTDPKVKRLEAALEMAIDERNDAEVEEIRDLLKKLTQRNAQAGDENPKANERSASLVAPPFFINCGGRRIEAEERGRRSETIRQLPDQPFSDRSGYGYSGGESVQNWFSGIWGTSQPELYRSARINPASYRFNLPAGDYIVALGFCETGEHTEGRRLFDVLIQDVLVAKNLDLFAVAGNAQAFRLVQAAKVQGDDALTIRFSFKGTRPPLVNAIWVYPRRSTAPASPVNFRGAGSYGMNILFWDHPPQESVAGYLIERRATGEAAFAPLVEKPVPVSRWLDNAAMPGTLYDYRIRSVDVDGRRSDFSKTLSLMPKNIASSSLPVYSLKVPDDSLAYMLSNVNEDREADATFLFEGQAYPVHFRVRGASTRQAAKKSYRVEFSRTRPAGHPKVIYLKAEPHDPTLQQEKLTCDVFAAMGLPISKTEFVNVILNGRYQGVYLDIEPIRSPFKKRACLDPDGTLIRGATFQHLDGGTPGELRGSDGSLGELTEFIRQLNRTDRGEFEAFVRAGTDWQKVRDYLVASIIVHRAEIEAKDYFYYRNSRTLQWSSIPWDHNNGNFGIRGPGTGPGRPVIPLWGQTLQATGPTRNYWYSLPTRILDNGALRKEYLDNLSSAVTRMLLSGRVDELVDHNFQRLKSEAVLDPFRWQPGMDEPFLASAKKLKAFVADHATRLLDLIASEKNRQPSPVVINEFHFGCDNRWVELHNCGPQRVSLAGYALGDIEHPRRPHLRFGRSDMIEPGEFRVVKLDSDVRGPALAERTVGAARESEAERHEKRNASLFDLNGGCVGLFASKLGRADDEDSGALQVVDFYFYGHQSVRYSYGRAVSGFGFMNPTPGRKNDAETFSPPSLMTDGGVQWKDDKPQSVSVHLTSLCPSVPPQSVRLHYRAGGRWNELPMALDADEGKPILRATAFLPVGTDSDVFQYYFVAKAANGLERYAPLTAPDDSYQSSPTKKLH